MTPGEIRNWLDLPTSKRIIINDTLPGIPPGLPGPMPPANSSVVLYSQLSLTLANGVVTLAGRAGDTYDGVYLPDLVNQCARVNCTEKANGILVSGRYNGCTFVKCTAGRSLFAGHVYVNGAVEGNDPNRQIRSFEADCGTAHAQEFRTAGLVRAPASFGLVIGTSAGDDWQWRWLTLDPNGVVQQMATMH